MITKPLYRWTLDRLIEQDFIDQVIINTDARQILAENGLVDSDRVMIRDRSTNLCGDDVSMNLILGDDIANNQAATYLMTHTTNPMLTPATIAGALAQYQAAAAAGTADSLFTVNKIQTRFYREDTSPVNHAPDNLIPTQNLEPWYEENSNLYIFTKNSFIQTDARIGRMPMMYQTSKLESVDIDTHEDWALADCVAAMVLSAKTEAAK
jgi:CMP-N-acetylneuraminic acid synthetase